MTDRKIEFKTRVLRKHPDLPRYVVVRPEHLGERSAAFAADVSLNGAGPFARTVRPWGKGTNVFFVNLTASQCAKAGVDTNDECIVTILPTD